MKKENLALAGLVVIIVVAVSAFLFLNYSGEIFEEGSTGGAGINIGDCADVHFIGRYASNDTVFDSSYADVENKIGGTPLQVFVTLNKTQKPPQKYAQNYSSGFVEGLLKGLIGLKENEAANITVSPEEGYGKKRVEEGDTVNTNQVCPQLNQTFTVTNLNNEKITLKWIDLPENNFTMPIGCLKENITNIYSYLERFPPYYLWENSSNITSSSSDNVTVVTTPTNNSEDISSDLPDDRFLVGKKRGIVIPEIMNIDWNETKITISFSPEMGGTYDVTLQGQILTSEVTNITSNNFTLTFSTPQGSQSMSFNKTITFNRTYSCRRVYKIPISLEMRGQKIPFARILLKNALNKADLSLHELAGKTLKYEVTIEKVYKISN